MITELLIKDPTRMPCSWWPKIEAFQGRDKFTFQEAGLTILWGPNGSGKSTLLKILARLTHCEQGGSPKITQASVWELQMQGALGGKQEWRDGVEIIHDGEPVHFLDPSKEVGLVGGAFDDDFFSDGLQSLDARKTSSGQNVTGMLNRVLERAATAEKIESVFARNTVNEVWKGHLDKMWEFLEPSTVRGEKVSPGPRTLLLDEPDRSLSIPRQRELWHILAKQERFQIIVATHSVFALYRDARYIDVTPGYLAECREELEQMMEIQQLTTKLTEEKAKRKMG